MTEQALVVMPHPDDADFGAGGTVATWTAEGVAVTYCIVTDGGAGAGDPAEGQSLAEHREAEQAAAARALGVSDVRFLGYRDGELEASIDLRRDIARLIRLVRPERVVAPTPRWNLDTISACHPDHLAVGAATCFAVYPEATLPPPAAGADLLPHQVSQLWLMSDPAPNTPVDITDVFDAKLAAIHAHASQLGPSSVSAANFRRWAAEAGERWKLGPGRLAEEFRVLTLI